MPKRKVAITDTTLRDAHQSLLATRMRLEHMLPIAEKIDAVGYHSLEVWGGATFDSCLRFLNEDPWERLRQIRKHFPRTKLQMLLRGQNLVGYKNYADDVVDAFVHYAVKNGIDILRIFDALNDVRNMQRAIQAAKKEGAHVQATVSYTISPVHDVQHYVQTARQLRELGADSICVKDMAGILKPYVAYELVGRLKDSLDSPSQLHCHYTSGMAAMTYLKAIEAGLDVLDCAISSMAMGTSQPAAETLVATLQGTEYDTGLDLDALAAIAAYFKDVRREYGEFDVAAGTVDPNVLRYQIPGGMVSNFISQLRQQNALDKLEEVLAEVPRVRQELGYPPLVTPTSQIVGSQAVLNVLTGERYKMVTNEVKQYVRGYYGRPPAPLSDEFRRRIIGDEEAIDCRPGDLLEPELPAARAAVSQYRQQEEDVVSYAIFPQETLQFLKEKLSRQSRVDFDIVEENERSGCRNTYPV